MEEDEQWRDVAGYEGLYQVSTHGRVRSLPRFTTSGRLLQVCGGMYPVVTLSKNGVRPQKLTHRLVALAFIPNPENKPCVNHKDGDKWNNNVSNLEWCTYSENELHSHRVLGKQNSRLPLPVERRFIKFTPNMVINIRHCRGAMSHEALAAVFGVSRSWVTKVLSGDLRAELPDLEVA